MSRPARNYRVERAGDNRQGYIAGWFAYDRRTGDGIYTFTWHEAMAWVNRAADREAKSIIRSLDRDTLADRLARLHRGTRA